jgi:DNA modification methylase
MPLLDSGEQWIVSDGDALDLLTQLPDASVDVVVCDPPYGIDFKNNPWDGQTIRAAAQHGGRRLAAGQAYECWTTSWAIEAARVLKPGGHLVAHGAPRTVHRLTSGLEDAGLEIRDMLMWMFGPGLPKSRRLDDGSAPTLKPFYEPIVLARRPPIGTVADARATHGTGTLNIDACAVGDDAQRWPAPVLLSHAADCQDERCAPDCPARLMDDQWPGASRFLYAIKASRRERDAGCDHLPPRVVEHFPIHGQRPPKPLHNTHPTVKPLALARWLIRLTAPTRGLVLDPFCGSGTTGIAAMLEGRRFVGIEREERFVEIARSRIAHWETNGEGGGAGAVVEPRPTVAGSGTPAP